MKEGMMNQPLLIHPMPPENLSGIFLQNGMLVLALECYPGLYYL
jgi:hypothetical protein